MLLCVLRAGWGRGRGGSCMAVDFARTTLNAGEDKCKYLSQLTGRETFADDTQERVSFLWA